VGEAKFFEGRLAGFADGKVRMELKGKETRTVELPLEAIRKANAGGGVLRIVESKEGRKRFNTEGTENRRTQRPQRRKTATKNE